ncbi:MAG: type II secretion system GspH family protein [Kiritimatiellaeota bacterium]|nr:type II secretion system GspH family protein [Kiritimatiellota bacterium]
MNRNRRQAFTLIEMMIVISVITILLMATFKLFRAAAHAKKETETKARMQRIENALSGYYAAYGEYPPVPFYADLNPDNNSTDPDSRNNISNNLIERAKHTARYLQPVAFEFPTPTYMDKDIPIIFKPADVQAVNQVRQQIDDGASDWNSTKVFKFGLMSFLLPKLSVVGLPPNTSAGEQEYGAPHIDLFGKAQWLVHSPDPTRKPGPVAGDNKFLEQLRKQQAAEEAACANWLLNLEGTVSGGGSAVGSILNINVWTGGTPGGLHTRTISLMSGGDRLVAVWVATIVDAWDRQFYYYSPPPYQSYRLWSAGPDGNTFPPWIDLNNSKYASEKKTIAGWTKDDIVSGSY